jgi:nickel-dependent lactate racemase
MTTLTFGNSLSCKLELGDYTFLAPNCELHPTLDDPALAVREALANPRDYPALAAATVPGDHIAVAVDSNVPQLRSILRGVIGAMLDADVPPAMITIVSADGIENRDELDRDLAEMGAGGVKFALHDPDDEQALAMVGVNSHGEPLRMNRTLAEADFVLPIGVGQSPTANGEGGEKFASLFPRFSTREAADRMKAQAASESPKQHKRRSKEIDEAGWLLGVGMTLSVVPAAAGGVAAVIAGDPQAVAQAASEQSRAVWERPAERQGDLVIATVVGDRREQTWENLARALSAAAPLVEPGGAIALYTELDQSPSGPLNRLLEAVDFGDVQRELMQDDAVEAHPAMMLARALDFGPVYLRSRLPADVVESLGMTPIEDDNELAHLAAGRAHCVVVEEAQRVICKYVPRDEL